MTAPLPGDAGFHRRAAALLRSAANDLKRDDVTAAADLGLPVETFREHVSGARPMTWDLIARAVRVWPLSERDLLPLRDDIPDGVVICSAADSLASSRALARGGVPYYEYRDTAMSRVASYRPERIQMLRVVGDVDPGNSAVEWNDGHLLYQFTYFVGPVNYYHRWEGTQHCVPMHTGDSVWGVPFAPHSFAARNDSEEAYILALTYGGDLVGDAQRELAVLGPEAAARLALGTTRARAHGQLLAAHVAARLLSINELARASGLRESRVADLCDGGAEPDWPEMVALADALGVSVRDLLPRQTNTRGGVSVKRRDAASRWAYPDREDPSYEVVRLAGDPFHPDTTAVELTVLDAAATERGVLTTHQHTYGYVLDGAPVSMTWEHGGERHERVLAPGDSVYVAPTVRVAFARGEGRGSLLLLRIAGAATTDVRFALGQLAEGDLHRYLAEDRMWYRPEGRERGGSTG